MTNHEWGQKIIMTIGFIGNPNCGKTTLFNAYTGANLKVANWPGVTVEKREGTLKYQNETYTLVDLPGTYSLSSYTMEEILTRNYILSNEVDVLINVVDASALERNLYLTLQLAELGKPVVLALNMMDILKKRGIQINPHRLSETLGIPVIPVSAKKRTGLDILIRTASNHANTIQKQNPFIYSRERYNFIEKIIKEVLINKEKSKAVTDKIDAVLTNRFAGLPIFLLIMGMIFLLTFLIGGWLKVYFEIIIKIFSGFIESTLTAAKINPILHSLVIDGIIAGVGGILTFLPNIFVLFFALAFLEDSGYMSRVAYVMDGIMGRFGLSGKAFIPILLGFGCSVPAIMAARSLESMKDRLRVMLVIPFMSCSAKLPIYVLFSGMFFPDNSALIAFSMYIIGLVFGFIPVFILHRTDKTKEKNMLIIELPEYKTPSAHTIFIYVWEKVKDYLSRAGTVIFAASVILWAIMRFGVSGYTTNISESFGAVFGKYLAPVLTPAGLGFWQAGVALIAGFAAKEIVAASFAILFGVANVTSHGGMALLSAELNNIGFYELNAYCLMLFSLLYPPCVATLAAIKRESRSWGQVVFVMGFQILFAWTVSFAVYQVGLIFNVSSM